jgi:hypothetical protein
LLVELEKSAFLLLVLFIQFEQLALQFVNKCLFWLNFFANFSGAHAEHTLGFFQSFYLVCLLLNHLIFLLNHRSLALGFRLQQFDPIVGLPKKLVQSLLP